MLADFMDVETLVTISAVSLVEIDVTHILFVMLFKFVVHDLLVITESVSTVVTLLPICISRILVALDRPKFCELLPCDVSLSFVCQKCVLFNYVVCKMFNFVEFFVTSSALVFDRHFHLVNLNHMVDHLLLSIERFITCEARVAAGPMYTDNMI